MRAIDLNGPMKERHLIVFFTKNLVFLPADFYPQEDSWDHPISNSRSQKRKPNPSSCSPRSPESIHGHGLS